jgi:hypothetical protein
MARSARLVIGAVIGLCLCASAGEAQSTLPVVYVQAGPLVTSHLEGEQYHRASPPLTGTTFGAAFAIGARFVPEVGAEVSVAVDGTLSDQQANVYFTRTDYTAESQNIVVDVNLRFRPRGGSRLEFTAGGGWAFTRFAQRNQVSTTPFPPNTVAGFDYETTGWAPTLRTSMAIAVSLSPHVELVPSVGARWIRRESDTQAWYLGVGRFSVFGGVALRLKR